MRIEDTIKMQELEKYDYILGIDLGHGETTVAFLNRKKDVRPKDLKFDSSDSSKIVSGIFISNDMKQCTIGQLGRYIENIPGKYYTYFKDRCDRLVYKYPGSLLTKKEVMLLFINEVMKAIFKYNANDIKTHDKDKTLVFVGCPSSDDWLEQDTIYSDMISHAIGMPVVIMPESRAALVKTYAQEGDLAVKDGILVLDSGSSTFDATYINGEGKQPNVEYSERLGASLIEKSMLECFLEKVEKKSEDLLDEENTLMDLRMIKENFYKGKIDDYVCKFKNKKKLVIEIDEEFMNEAVDKRPISYSTCCDGKIKYDSWCKACEIFYRKVKEKIGNKPLKVVLLTGGASRMKFSQELCKDVFGVKVVVDVDPSYSVSRGLAQAGNVDCKGLLLKREMKEQIMKKIEGMFGLLASRPAALFAEEAYKISTEEFAKWAAVEESTNTLEKELDIIKRNIEQYIDSEKASQITNKCLSQWLEEVRELIVKSVNDTFAKNYPNKVEKVPPFELNDEVWQSILHIITNKEGININIYQNIQYQWLDSLAVGIVKFIVALLIFFIPFVGERWSDELCENKLKKVYSKKKREELLRQYIQNKEKYMADIKSDIEKSLGEEFKKQEGDLIGHIYKSVEGSIDEAVDTVALYFY